MRSGHLDRAYLRSTGPVRGPVLKGPLKGTPIDPLRVLGYYRVVSTMLCTGRRLHNYNRALSIFDYSRNQGYYLTAVVLIIQTPNSGLVCPFRKCSWDLSEVISYPNFRLRTSCPLEMSEPLLCNLLNPRAVICLTRWPHSHTLRAQLSSDASIQFI